MATEAQQSNLLFKKHLRIGYTSTDKQEFEEPFNSRQITYPSDVWRDLDQVPTTAPGGTDGQITGVVQRFLLKELTPINGSPDSFYHADLKDAIPHDFDPANSYNHLVFENDGITAIPFGTGAWHVNSNTGILSFFAGAPAGVTALLPPKISYYKYAGDVGLGNSVESIITQAGHGFAAGDAVFFNGTIWAKALANAATTVGTHIIKDVQGDTFVAVQSGKVTISGYNWGTLGAILYVSDSVAGALTETEPSISNPIGVIETAESLHVIPWRSLDAAAISGGGTSVGLSQAITQASHGFVVTDLLYFNGTNWVKAQADVGSTVATHMVVEVVNINEFKVGSSGIFVLTAHGIGSAGDWFYTSASSAGATTTTEPTSPNFSNPMGFVKDANTICLVQFRATSPGFSVGTANGLTVFKVSQTSHGFTVGQVVLHNGTNWILAIANSFASVGTHVVVDVEDATNFVVASGGRHEISSHGLGGAGDWLYTSPTVPGGVTNTEPSISNPIIFVESTDVFHVFQLRASNSGFTSSSNASALDVHQVGHGLTVGSAVYFNGTNWALAQSNSASTLGSHIISAVVDVDNFTVSFSGATTITTHGLGSAGDVLYVSGSVAGDFVTTEPVTNFSNPLGFVLDVDTIHMLPQRARDTAPAAAGSKGNWFGRSQVTTDVTASATYGLINNWAANTDFSVSHAFSSTATPPPNSGSNNVHCGWFSGTLGEIAVRVYNNSGASINTSLKGMATSDSPVFYVLSSATTTILDSSNADIVLRVIDTSSTLQAVNTEATLEFYRQ